MPSSLLLLLPLLGGYVLSHTFHFLRFRAQGLDGHRLIFEAGLAGLVWLVPARLFIVLIRPHVPLQVFGFWVRMTNGEPFIATAALATTLAGFAGLLLNLLCGRYFLTTGKQSIPFRKGEKAGFFSWPRRPWKASREYFLNSAIKTRGNALQKILHRAAIEAKNGTLVGLTLDDRRIYAGFVATAPNLSPSDDFVSLYPVMSGYRDDKALRVTYNYRYPIARLKQCMDRIASGEADSETEMMIPCSVISSVHVLDKEDMLAIERQLVAGASTEPPPDAFYNSGD